jgi:diguanylate cyclase (GGDEF)-like protein
MSSRLPSAYAYALGGLLCGLLAPAGLLLYVVLTARGFDPAAFLVLVAVGGPATGLAGWMVGRRQERLASGNRRLAKISENLQTLSTSDPLTGLPNRRAFDERLQIELARAARYRLPMALVMIDLDHFKRVNDRHGHRAGDEVLRAVAGILERGRRTGDLVARYGGEELVALLPHSAVPAARAWAERMRQRIAGLEIPWAGGALRVTASFGLAVYPASGTDRDGLVDASDQALYLAKRGGRNRVAVSRAAPNEKKPVGLTASHARRS